MNLTDTFSFIPSPFHTPGRNGQTVKDIVAHWMDTDLAGADATFTHPGRNVSAHYGIENTTGHQYVAEGDTAWHAGTFTENLRSIGIEHSAAPGRDATPATIETSIQTMTEICQRYQINPLTNIYPHNRFFATACPGTLPLPGMILEVHNRLTHTGTLPTPPPAPLPEEDVMLVIAKNANGPDMWVGNFITRSHISNAQTLKDMQYLWQKLGTVVHDLGPIADLDAIGTPIGTPPKP